MLENYKPSLSVEEEFPNSDGYRKGRYAGREPSSPQIMRNLLADIMARAQAVGSGGGSPSAELYVELATIACILQESHLLCWLCDLANRVHRPWKPQVEKLNRRLTKACQYYHGINNLIGYAKRHFPHDIKHRWVDTTASTEQTTIHLDDFLEAVKRALGSPLSNETVAMLRDRFPDIEKRWDDTRFLKTRLHPEICIVLDLSTPFKSSDRGFWRPIGCNKRSCLCCTAWLRTYSLLLGPRWLMSRTDGKADATWALPGCSYAHAIVRDGKSCIDESARRAVGECLIDHLYSLFPVLSGPESDWKPGKAQARLEAMVKNYDHFIKDDIDNKKRPGVLTRVMKQFKRNRNT
ncbi:hypothetical protein EDC04DRAFT_2857824 [Pisolithus marmoratus]|nr:hypothetical protein EDC04DRAFT_2857824 [Pisolithus marmoratus]